MQQTGEYATDEEDAGTAADPGDKSIEVFDLPETEDVLSPSELDATKLYQKFREVMLTCEIQKLKVKNNNNSIKTPKQSGGASFLTFLKLDYPP